MTDAGIPMGGKYSNIIASATTLEENTTTIYYGTLKIFNVSVTIPALADLRVLK